MLELGKFSFGMGDRFAHQAAAQLRACVIAAERGASIVPVWNKSNREHLIVGSEPPSVREAARAAVQALGWKGKYHIDADHINLTNVERFIEPSDFFTIDVASFIGQPAPAAELEDFVNRHGELTRSTPREEIARIASKYLVAVREAKKIYEHIAEKKGAENFITEISMDETDSPQTPNELLVILAAIADARIPIQTIAPKFSGRFNKGVDYQGDLAQFEKEFTDDLAVIAHATDQYGLPKNLKLSVHSGSDKFSIYQPIRRALAVMGAGLHLKTAGTTWLEELIGLAEADGDGLALAKEIYIEAREHLDELCAPYATVIDIDGAQLPSPVTVQRWSSMEFVAALRHEPGNPAFNPHLRQLLHVGYKIAAKKGEAYLVALRRYEKEISRNVTSNLLDRHIAPLFL